MRAPRSRSALFLMELVLAIGLLAVTAAVCIELFARAHRLSRQSEALSRALIVADSAAEGYKATGGELDALAELLSGSVQGDRLYVYYGADWNTRPTPDPEGYTLLIESQAHPRLNAAYIRVADATSRELYSLTVKHFEEAVS
jgi:type II secretory pathway pseudopilin PulG